jgi:hypothetical protein
MEFIKRNVFWLGISLAVVALIVLYLLFVMPLRRELSKSTKELETGQRRLQALLGGDIANNTKIEKAKETAGVFRQRYGNVETYFAGRKKTAVKYWPEVFIDGKLEPALFVVEYRKRTKELEEKLGKDMELGASVFKWKSFGDRLPEPKDCEGPMEHFRMMEELALEIVQKSGAVTTLESVTLNATAEPPFLTVRDLEFATRKLDISGKVSFQRLLFLIAELERSDLNIFVDTLSITQVETQLVGQEEPPVSVSLKCSMLYGKKKE